MKLYHSQSQKNSPLFQPPLTQETNGQAVFTPSEIKDNAVHAGPSLPLKLFQIDSVLPQTNKSTLSSPQKTWSHVTLETWDAMVDTWTEPGNTSKDKELLPIHASNTLAKLKLAQPTHAPTVANSRNTSARLDQLLLPDQLLKSNPKSTLTDPWKPDSQSTLTSTTTDQVSTDTPQEVLLVDTPLRSSVGELITGSPPTLGEQVGEKTDSSELPSDNAVLTALSMPAHHKSEHLLQQFND